MSRVLLSYFIHSSLEFSGACVCTCVCMYVCVQLYICVCAEHIYIAGTPLVGGGLNTAQ